MFFSALLDAAAWLVLLAGLVVCALNIWIAFHNLRHGSFTSMVPLVGSLLLGGLWLLLGTEEIPWSAALPFLLLDVSTLPSLLGLPFFLLLRALRGAEAPPLLPRALKAGLLALYLFWAGCIAVGQLLLLVSGG